MIDETTIKQAVEKLHKEKRKFSQSYDLIFALKDLNLKNPEEQVEFFVQALQLIHAGQRPALRVRTTLATLDQLSVTTEPFEHGMKRNISEVCGKVLLTGEQSFLLL